MEFWNCGSRKQKKKGEGCPVGGTISHKNLIRACTEVLGLEKFDEAAFLDKVDHIEVPERYVLKFYLKDGTTAVRDCPNTGHQDCWTPEYRAKVSAKRRREGTNPKGASCFTAKIKCAHCGCNFRKATQPAAGGQKTAYWRCADRDGCVTKGLRDDRLRELSAAVLGLKTFDEDVFRERVEYISVLSDTEIAFHFKDGCIENRLWDFKRLSHRWTEEQRAKFKESIKSSFTPERRQKMSEHMKQIRKERGKEWRREK